MGRLAAWIQGFAESLGGPGLFIISYLDSSFLSFPQVCDALIVLLTVRHESRMLYYATATTLGSIAGCFTLYLVGRKGGEALLRKRFTQGSIDRAMDMFRRYGILAIVVPSLMPPPMPFKVFVLGAGVARVGPYQFLLAVTIGRGIRYFGEGFLALWYGEEALVFLRDNAHTIGLWFGLAVLAGAVIFVLLRRRWRAAA